MPWDIALLILIIFVAVTALIALSVVILLNVQSEKKVREIMSFDGYPRRAGAANVSEAMTEVNGELDDISKMLKNEVLLDVETPEAVIGPQQAQGKRGFNPVLEAENDNDDTHTGSSQVPIGMANALPPRAAESSILGCSSQPRSMTQTATGNRSSVDLGTIVKNFIRSMNGDEPES